MSLGVLLRSRREARGVSLSIAASGIGTTKQHLWELETGRTNNPILSMLIGLMAYYKISWSEIIQSYEG